MRRFIVCLTFDHDHMSGFISRGMTSPTAISRGEYDLVAIPRIVDLLKRYDIKATFFTPGHTIESATTSVESRSPRSLRSFTRWKSTRSSSGTSIW